MFHGWDFRFSIFGFRLRFLREFVAGSGVGFDDRGILQITLIASWFNYINRVADALGVGRD